MDARGRRQVPTPYPPPTKTYFIYYDCDHRLCTDVCPPLTSSSPRVLFRPLPCPSSASTLVPTLSVPLQRCAVHLSSASFPSILSFYSRVRSSTVFYILENRSQANESAYYLRLEDTSAELRRKGSTNVRRPPFIDQSGRTLRFVANFQEMLCFVGDSKFHRISMVLVRP